MTSSVPTSAFAPVIVPRTSPKRRARQARREVAKLQQKIQRLEAEGKHKKAKRFSRLLMRSFNGKLATVSEIAAKERSKGRRAPDGQQLLDFASQINLWRQPDDLIHVKLRRKSKPGQFRIIHSFGMRDKVMQTLAAQALAPLLPATDRQFSTAGKGRQHAVSRVVDEIEHGGRKWVCTADIKSFFPSIDRDWLRQNLPVSERITANTLFAEGYNRKRGHGCSLNTWQTCCDNRTMLIYSQQGLVQGACSSSLIAEYVMAQVISLIPLPEGVELVVYADNLVFLGNRKNGVEEAVETFTAAFAQHPAGNFRLVNDGVRRASDGFDFMGYHIRKQRGVRINPLKSKIAQFRRKMLKLARYVSQAAPYRKQAKLRALAQYMQGWVNSFSASPIAGWLAIDAVRDLARIFSWRGQSIWQTAEKLRQRIRQSVSEFGLPAA